MAGEPTLYHGNQSADGWVEYLQDLLMHQMTDLGNHNHTRGLFDDFTLAAVKEFQQRKNIKDDGIVGDQTWAALRGEPYIPKAGDDGRAPGTYVEQGIELRFIGQ
jgi:murein L,D-transpeptidase YcbB/YkuD